MKQVLILGLLLLCSGCYQESTSDYMEASTDLLEQLSEVDKKLMESILSVAEQQAKATELMFALCKEVTELKKEVAALQGFPELLLDADTILVTNSVMPDQEYVYCENGTNYTDRTMREIDGKWVETTKK